LIKTPSPNPDWHVLQVKDPAREEIDCKNYKDDLEIQYDYTLVISQNDEETEVSKLVCKNKVFVGTTEGTPPVPDTQINQADFSAYCRAKIENMCTNPMEQCTSSDDHPCPTFNAANATSTPTLTCPGGKWLINNEYRDGIQPECKGDDIELNVASFYFIDKTTGITEKMKNGIKCFQNYDCKTKSNFDFSLVNITGQDKIYCESGHLRVLSNRTTLNETEYTCNKNEGIWTNNKNNKKIGEDSRAVCEKDAPPPSEESWASKHFGLIIAVLVVVIVTICAVITFLFYICCLSRNAGQRILKSKIKKWKSMSRNKRMKLATNVFNQASLASPFSSIHIMNGLELLHAMLEADTEDPEIWERAYPFLDRFNGASRTRGNRMCGLFSRYLYLQAKRIINKHGWTTTTPITRTHYKGYIRTVALRLMFYGRFNAYTPEFSKFIGEGFNKLRYNAVEQYPHCGMLWAHVATSRCKAYEIEFMEDLTRIATIKPDSQQLMNIPEDDRFPSIGNVCEQASLAIGGSTLPTTKRDYAKDLVEQPKNRSLAFAFIRGFLQSSQADIGANYRANYAKNQDSVAFIKNTFAKDDWNYLLNTLSRMMICYGQHQEAKRLENFSLHPEIHNVDRKKPEGKKNLEIFREMPPGPIYTKFYGEQKRFEKELAAEEMEILTWLASRMDKEALRDSMADHTKANENYSRDQPVDAPSTNFVVGYCRDPTTGLCNEDSFFAALEQGPNVITRIRQCQLTEDEKARYRVLLEKIFSKETITALRIDFAPDDVVEICSKVKDIVRTEPFLIEDIPGDINVLTDTHGQIFDIDRVFKANAVNGKPGYECAKYLFLGDYVDRGDMSLEVVMAVFILKALYPDRFFLLRGNHECPRVNRKMDGDDLSLIESLYERYEKKEARSLYAVLNSAFAYLSGAAIIGDKIFCAHAGISMGSFTRHEMRRMEKPYAVEKDILLEDITWSDPAIGLKGITFHFVRGTSIYFGEDEFVHAMENIGCEAMIRGHLVMIDGVKLIWNRLFSVFTATANSKDGTANVGAFCYVDEKLMIHCKIMAVDTIRFKPKEASNGAQKNSETDSGDITISDGCN
ncbi:hypothetical protein PFISCL1PPCAC_26032, partial [Pristionchus fissidentatus]